MYIDPEGEEERRKRGRERNEKSGNEKTEKGRVDVPMIVGERGLVSS